MTRAGLFFALVLMLVGMAAKAESFRLVYVNDHPMISLRDFCYQFDAYTDYDLGRQALTVTRGNRTVYLIPYSNKAWINDCLVKMVQPVVIIDDTTYVPLRFLCHVFELNCDWRDNYHTASIYVYIGGPRYIFVYDEPWHRYHHQWIYTYNYHDFIHCRPWPRPPVVIVTPPPPPPPPHPRPPHEKPEPRPDGTDTHEGHGGHQPDGHVTPPPTGGGTDHHRPPDVDKPNDGHRPDHGDNWHDNGAAGQPNTPKPDVHNQPVTPKPNPYGQFVDAGHPATPVVPKPETHAQPNGWHTTVTSAQPAMPPAPRPEIHAQPNGWHSTGTSIPSSTQPVMTATPAPSTSPHSTVTVYGHGYVPIPTAPPPAASHPNWTFTRPNDLPKPAPITITPSQPSQPAASGNTHEDHRHETAAERRESKEEKRESKDEKHDDGKEEKRHGKDK